MRTANLCATALLVGLLLPVGSAFGQHNWQRTITVDPQLGAADHQTIQLGINDVKIGNNPTVRFTVLIFAGTYTENVTLGGMKENVDLVGIDRESVIIKPSSGDGILITSGTETSRNNLITNLTIITTTGDGIRIVKGGTPAPKDITIEGVTIEADGSGKDGIYASQVQNLRIADVDITTTDGHGIEIVMPPGGRTPKDITIEHVTIHADGAGKLGVTGVDAENVTLTNCLVTSDDGDGMHVGDHWTLSQVTVETIEEVGGGSAFDQDALVVADHTFLTITDSTFIGERRSIWMAGAEDILVQNSRLTTSGAGGVLTGTLIIGNLTKHVLFQNCLIVSDATQTGVLRATPRAVFLEDNPVTPGIEDIILQSCHIIAVGDDSGTGSTLVAAVDDDLFGTLTLVDCVITANNLNDATVAAATGVLSDGRNIRVLGGVISTSSAAEKETLVWDVESFSGSVEISGTRFSKWKGAIASAERPRSVIQRTIGVGIADDDLILTALDGGLTGSEQPNVTPSDQPDVYRVLSVTGNKTGMFQNVYIIGTDWADNVITEKIQLNETTPRDGFKPFKTVDHIILPAQNGAGETVKIGIINKLGLYYPISADVDVLQQARQESGASSYKIETLDSDDVDELYATIFVETITAGDSFEWAILASQ